MLDALLRSRARAACEHGLTFLTQLAPHALPTGTLDLLLDLAAREPDGLLRAKLITVAGTGAPPEPHLTTEPAQPPPPTKKPRDPQPAPIASPPTNQETSPEAVVVVQTKALPCQGDKMGITVMTAKLGDLVLTTDRLVFQPYGK